MKSITYTQVSTTDPDLTQIFSVNSAGVISVTNPTSTFFVPRQIIMVIDARDKAGTPAQVTVTINVVVGFVTPIVTVSAYSVAENALANDLVGFIAANDPQGSYPLTYSIESGNINSVFRIDAVAGSGANFDGSGGNIRINTAGILNFLAIQSYSLVVVVTNSASRSKTVIVSIDITESNKAPYFPTLIMSFTVSENSAAGVSVGQITGVDPNTHTTPTVRVDTLTYTITTANVPFSITSSGSVGTIQVANGALLDFETQSLYTLSVTVSDGTLSGSGTVVISLTNANDLPTLGDLSGSVNENAVSSSVITVSGSDQDIASSGQSLRYSLSRSSLICWSFLSTSFVNVNQFVPLALAGSTPASGVVQTVYARFQRISTSGSATVVLSSGVPSSSPGTSDRYEIVFAAGSTSGTTTVSRCTTTSCTSQR
jgi:hypothetical protein